MPDDRHFVLYQVTQEDTPRKILALNAIMPLQEDDMARRRFQQRGDLYQQGGWWKLRWQEDRIGADGQIGRGWSSPVVVGPAKGHPGLTALTERQARRAAWEQYLSRLDQNVGTPRSVMTFAEFIERKFTPEHVALLRPSGQAHYKYMLAHAQALGGMRLRDVTADQVQRVVSAVLLKGASTQTARHVRNAVSAVFNHAERIGWHPGPNPARHVRLPEMIRKPAHALSFEQTQTLLRALPSPEREMALAMVLTSVNVAELCGLQWRHVNFADSYAVWDGEAVPPLTIAVRQQFYRGRFGPVKVAARRRDVPMPSLLVSTLGEMRRRLQWTGPQDPVFAARNGRPVDEHNAMRRHIKPVGLALGMPWLSWHVFRRTHATLAAQLGASFSDRMALMGHADMRMTCLYTMPDQDRRRAVLEQMADRLIGETKRGVQ